MKNEEQKEIDSLKKVRDLTAERDAEIIPVAKRILLALAEREDLLMGSKGKLTMEEAAIYYQKLYQEIVIPILIETNIKLNSVTYLFSIMQQPIQLLQDVTNSSFEMNRDIADAKKWGINDIDDLRVKDLDVALRAEVVKTVDKQ